MVLFFFQWSLEVGRIQHTTINDREQHSISTSLSLNFSYICHSHLIAPLESTLQLQNRHQHLYFRRNAIQLKIP